MKKLTALLALVFAATALVACGDDSDSGTSTTETATTTEAAGGQATNGGATGGEGSTVSLEADPDGALAYTTDSASTSAGDVTIDFNNPQALLHDVDVEDSSGEDVGETELISNDSTSVTLQDMQPGEYTFYCSVSGHREAGMEGTLTIK